MNDPPDNPPLNSIPLARGVWVTPDAVRWSFTRSRGPGGQSVNKVSTAAEIRVAVESIVGLDEAARRRLRRLAGQRLTAEDDLLVRADTFRSQVRNRTACLERLVELVARAATPPAVRKPTRPGRAAIRRRIETKRQQGEKKQRRKPPDW